MKYKELLNIFEDRFPFAKYYDYRPICHELFTDDKIGITLFLENGDIIEYYPAIMERKEDEQRYYEASVKMAEYCEMYEPTYNREDGSM